MQRAHPARRKHGSQFAFLVDQLGFENASWGTADFTYVSRDLAGIYLCQRDQGRGAAWAWIGVEDVGKLHEVLLARSLKSTDPKAALETALN